MSPWKKTLMQQGLKLMADPRVAKLMQDERVTKALMTAMSVPAKAQSFAKEQAEHLAKAMALATEGEVKDLRRTVRRLEEDLARLKAEQQGSDPSSGPAKRKGNAAE
jgi:DNA uptake protein ComE-like DNA-binding protein